MSRYSMATKQLILLSTLLHIMMRVDGNQTYLVHPHCNSTGESCLDFSMVGNISSNFNSSTTLIFQQGSHYLDSDLSLTGVKVLLQSNNETSESANIICRGDTRLSITNISQLLRISRLNFTGCSVTIKLANRCVFEYSHFDGENVSSSALKINETSVEILGSSFVSYIVGTYQKSVQFLDEVDHPYSLVHVLSHDARIGGALVITNSNITINNSHFAYNSAQLGGALFVEQHSNMIINDCQFVGNRATDCIDDHCNGGALFIDSGCIVTVHNTTFENNTSEFSGGAIALFRATFGGIQNEFNFNKARNFGGSIFAHFSSSISSDMSTFMSNEAGLSGGVMYADYLSSISIKNDAFYYNKATMTVCVTDLRTASMDLDNTCFDSEAGFGGGAFYARYGSTIDVENSSFSRNTAESDGGVMYAMSNSTITVGGSTFDGNSARYGGGVVYAYHYSSIAIHNSQFSDSEAGNAGGVFHIFYGSTLSIENSTFDNSRAGYIGGVLHAFYFSSVSINGSSFCNNNASYFGGVFYANYRCNITVHSSSFSNNIVNADGGVIFAYDNNTITVDSSYFNNNTADGNGGTVYASHLSHVIFKNKCILSNNTARRSGGVVFARDHASFTDLGSTHIGNTAEINGGSTCMFSEGDIKLEGSTFTENIARQLGGALHIKAIVHVAKIEGNIFNDNWAMNGGAISMSTADNLNMSNNTLTCNYARNKGGALHLAKGYNLTSNRDSFINNSAGKDGGVFYLQGQNSLTIKDSSFISNKAEHDGGVFFSLVNTVLNISGENCSFIQNQAQKGGVICMEYSTVNFSTQNMSMVGNLANESGGALHLSSSHLITSSETSLVISENQANRANGGAVYASDSNLQMNSLIEIRNNSASRSGGGLYLTNSTLEVRGNNTQCTSISYNTANISGGGLHAKNSTVMISGIINFANNRAQNGGGISLEGNDRLYGSSTTNDTLNFSSNIATYYGGALYVNDSSNTEFCVPQNTAATECFFSSVFLNFEGNIAGISGADLFGGFLDRCTPHFEQDNNTNGLESLRKSSNIKSNDTVSSLPVQVCFCSNGVANCTYRPDFIQVETEKSFSVEIIAYDQVTHGVNATFDCSLRSSSGPRQTYQMIQHVRKNCTKLNFNSELFTTLGLENLLLSVRGPCNVIGTSNTNVSINVTCSCPLGFQNSNNNNTCMCVCHEVLRPYNAECNFETRSIVRNDNFWITYYTELAGGYLIYPNCPFDYCHPKISNVTVNLNIPNGSDAQCASNRVGTLCGTCQPGLSVSLGSSHCLHCPTHWLWLVVTIVVTFILTGIALVCLLLVLNLTVAVGTLNAIIFYANIVAANKSVIFQTSEISFATVLISWLNFDIGFDTCFYNRMDTYVKTWLQLAFPLYIIILVAIIMKLSNFSDTFGHLIGKKDPVATLATLVLLSYTKFLQTVITVFSSAILVYSDGSRKYVWLPDATIEYITSKHALLFIAAILILLVGLIYTLLLFSWQWPVCCSTKRIKWIRNQKLNSFMEMYIIPYTPTHRYWTGLLLLIRVSIYLISAFNPSSDPRITLSSTIFIISFLFLYIAMFGVRMYKCWFINAMETLTYFNLIALSIFTWYTTDAEGNQKVVTNISIGITFAQLLAVLLYHVLRYANQTLYSTFKKIAVIEKLNKYINQVKCTHQLSSSHDNSVCKVYDILDMVDRPSDRMDRQVFCTLTTATSSTVEMSTSDLVEEEDLDSNPNKVNQAQGSNTAGQ